MFTSHSDQRESLAPSRNQREGFEEQALKGPSLVDPIYLVGKLFKAKWFILFCALAGAGLAAGYALMTPKLYEATTQVLVDPRDIKVVQNEVTPNGLPSDATLALIESQTAVIDSNDVLMTVIESADLINDPEFNGRGFSILDTVKDYLGLSEREVSSPEGAPLSRIELVTLDNLRRKMSVSRESKSFVLHLGIETTSPQKSARLANLLADTFINELGRVQSSTARRASDALSSRLEELRTSVSEAERAVEAYKQENRLVGVGGRLVDDDYILRINDQLARSRGDVTALRNKVEQMRAASVDDVVEGSFPEELTSTALNRLRDSYQELQQQEAILSTSLGPRHPRRIANSQAMNSARAAIRSEVGRIVSATETELSRAESTDSDLTAQIDTLKTKQLETSEAFVRLRELEREVEASRAVYEAFLLRAREIAEQERLNTANVRVISSATPPLNPSSLSRRSAVLIGFLAGFVAGFGIALAWALWKPMKMMIDENSAGRRFGDRRGTETLQPEMEPLSGLRTSDTSLPERSGGGDDYAWSDDATDREPLSLRAKLESDGTHRTPEHRRDATGGAWSSTGEGRSETGGWRFANHVADDTHDMPASEPIVSRNNHSGLEAEVAIRHDDWKSDTGRFSERIRSAARSAEEAEYMQKEIETIRERLMGLRAAANGEDRSTDARRSEASSA
ncbi:Lipopolysaccharide biosynthesis [Fulvimarina pelagi HTCC2506]|uniref:Lipopolysaccharide biosynthesis n=2 Tax=Fulvimarina pelagi TaxID=217511 RepID=Q0G549_9HYPH|nr:GumC family protein [Fulvimarina pelagi]EAU43215.1 Lipopolysaccharide biosynthesis [Fulvimarina pelagi HTCC2506]